MRFSEKVSGGFGQAQTASMHLTPFYIFRYLKLERGLDPCSKPRRQECNYRVYNAPVLLT